MKLYPVNLAVAMLLSAVLAYGLWSAAGYLQYYVAIGGFVFFVLTLVPAIGILIDSGRRATNFKIVCALFFVVALLSNIIFSFMPASETVYLVFHGVVFLIYVFLANAVFSMRQ